MKKVLSILVLAFFAMIQGFSQPIFESFEGTFPPTGWTVTGSWQQYSYRASDGGMCAYMAYSGTSGRMILPAYTADVTTTLSFYVGASYASDAWMNDFTIEVTTSLEEPAWQEVYTIAYPTNITDFILQEVNLGAFAGQEIYVSFNLTPNNGAGTLLDAVTLGNITCPKPTGLAVVPASTSADFTWDEDETSLAYNLEVVQSNQDWENAEVSQVTGTEFTLTDLEPATMYKARLQSVCEDEELSQYSNVITFTTACSPIEDVIWFEDFESVLGNQEAANLMFSCWSVLQSTGGAYNGTFPRIYHEGYAGSAHSGQVTLEFKGNGFLLLPEFAQDITTQQLSFYANTTASTVEGAGTFQVGYVTDPTDTASFVALETVILPQAGLSRASSVMVGPFSYESVESESARMALKYVAVNAGESWNLDDFTVEPIPDCPAPQSSSITVTGVTDSEATITWVDEDESHSAWLFYYKSSTEEDYTEIATTEQSITLTDLTQATAYSFYIQTDCGTDDNYSQTSVITFRTTAVPVTEFPYYQDFQDLEGNPFGAEFFTTGLNQWMIGSSTGVVDSENEELSSLYISNNNSDYAYTTQQNNSRSWVVMPIVFGDAPEYAISFQYKSGGEVSSWSSSVYDYLTVILCDADADLTNLSSVPSGTVVLDKAGGVTEWATATYASSELANTTKQLVFYWYNDGSDGSGIPGAIDNIAIIENTCAAPTNLTYTDVTGESAVLSWDTEGTSSWMLYYKAASDEEYTEVEVTEVPYTLTDLTPMTDYTAYVVTDCDGELSVASTAVSFRTACAAVETFPYFEGFNDVYNLQDACWSAEVLSGYSNWTTSIDGAHGNSPYEGGRCAYITYFSGEARLSSPIFDLTEMNNPYLKYVVANPAYSSSVEQIIVEYKATPESDWVTLRSYTTANETWLLDSVALPSPTENYQIAFKAIGGQGWGASIDAVQVYDSEGEPGGEEPQPCEAPTNLSANNITETSAEITWNGTASTYEFKLNGGAAETLTTTTKSLTGLTANTAYTVEVRAVCEDQQSAWVTTNFTTLEEIVTPEPCDAPTNLSANNITETSADITWNGTASTYEFKLNGGTAETLTTTTKALTGLTANTAYTVEVRAVCEDAESDWVTTTFTTLEEIPEIIAPVVTTTEATSVTHESAVLNGTITAGSEEITAQGFRYKTATASEWIEVSATGTTISATVNNLTAETTYVFKAFATTASGTVEGTEMTFTTIAAPIVVVEGEVTTTPATEVGNTSATLNGALVSAGNSENYTVGFALATVADFTLEDADVQNITATLTDATFSQAVNDLAEGQTYFFRAYITNEAGTAYGAVETFTLSGLNDAIANGLTATIYPNPANTQATLQINGLNQDAKIVISDIQGRILSQEEISASTTTYTINLNNMASGVYYVRIVTDNVISTQKLIVE
ncbi:MAG: fibronectin type III domain-containing protein [Bacteroidales bacterium]|nr:fibronectin type III domain-containing protein [Bacteroidales bacterium]